MYRRPFPVAVVFVLAAGVLLTPVVAATGRPVCLASNDRTHVGMTDLQAAIDSAAPGDTLVVKGSCVGHVTPLEQANFVIEKDLVLKGVSNSAFGQATLDGGGLGPVVLIRGGVAGGPTVTLFGLTITNGKAHDMSYGGLQNDHGVVALIDSVVSGNSARTAAGIGNYVGTMTLTNSTVSGNVADYGGGGIYNMGTLTLVDSTVSGNTGGTGGGIFNFRVDTIPITGLLTLTDSSIIGNIATASGGGILNQGYDDGLGHHGAAVVNATNSTISGNRAAGPGGGMMNFGTVTLTNSTVAENKATVGMGGGIFTGGYSVGGTVPALMQPATLTLTDSAVRDNSTGASGGGIFSGSALGDPSVLTLTGSTVARNSSPYSGGGIFNQATVAIRASTFAMNVAASGGAIANRGAITLTSPPTMIGGNTGTMWGGIANYDGTVSGGCPTVLGDGSPPSTRLTGVVVYDPPNISPWPYFMDYAGFSC